MNVMVQTLENNLTKLKFFEHCKQNGFSDAASKTFLKQLGTSTFQSTFIVKVNEHNKEWLQKASGQNY